MSRTWRRAALFAALLFAAPILYLAAHRLGWVARHPAIAYERTSILVLVGYAAAATLLVAAALERRRVAAWLRRHAASLALGIFTTLFCLTFVEVALRLLRPNVAEKDYERWSSPTLHHRNAPNRSSAGMFGFEIRTNSDGFRTGYRREDFLLPERRVVLLGDSYVFGLGVAEEETVARRLEAELRAFGGGEYGAAAAVVLNTGAISYSPFLERQVFRELARHYRPTLTLLFVDVNDIGDDYQYERENVSGDLEHPRFDVPDGPRPPSLCRRSAVCKALEPLWAKLFLPGHQMLALLGKESADYDYYRFEVAVGGVVEKDRFFVLRHPLAETRPFFERTLGHIENVARDARAAGSEFALVVMPRYFHWNDAECPRNWESFRYRVDEPYENAFLDFFDEARGRVDFPVLELIGDFRAHRGEPLVFEQDPHWNAAGHELAARSIARQLQELGWPGELQPPREPADDAAPRP